MKVKLIAKTDNILDVIYTSARTCYNPGSPIDMWTDRENITDTDKIKLINKIVQSGHLSPLEHVTFTFAIEGISRACSHQLVRHRLCSFSQQSQRYVKFDEGIQMVTPASISPEKDRLAYNIYERALDRLYDAYRQLLLSGVPEEDARALLPNACCTNIVMSVNLRELIHISNERLCTRAQAEIRQLVRKMVTQVISAENWTSVYLVPKCDKLHYCPEHKGCGRVETLKELICK